MLGTSDVPGRSKKGPQGQWRKRRRECREISSKEVAGMLNAVPVDAQSPSYLP